MKDRGNPLTVPAHFLCEGYSIDGVIIESVRFASSFFANACVIVKLANGKVLNFDLHDEVEVDR